MTWYLFGGDPEPAAPSVDNDAIFECDYDNNPTGLYQAMENEAWLSALDFLETGKWQDALGTKLFASDDPVTPGVQARTWVTRYDDDGTVRWSQLPFHAAIIFKAPIEIFVMLVKLHPQGARCTDDQHMLPLHLAIKYGSDDTILRLLVDSFPDAISTKDSRGRLPIQIEGPRHDRTKAMESIIAYTTKTVRRQHDASVERELRELREKLSLKDKLIGELGMHNHELERVYNKLQTKNDMLKGAIDTMEISARLAREEAHASRQPTIRGPLITGPLRVSSPRKKATQADSRHEMSQNMAPQADSNSDRNNSPTFSQNNQTKAKEPLPEESAVAATAAAETNIEVVGILEDIPSQEVLSVQTPLTTEYLSDAEHPDSPLAAATASKNKKSKSPKSYFKRPKSKSKSMNPEEESQASTARAELEGVGNDEEAAPESQYNGPQPEDPLSTTDKVIASRQKYQRNAYVDESNCETILTSLPKRQTQAAKSKKLPRRGFFKGMGTKE
jgi:hypothetical protein